MIDARISQYRDAAIAMRRGRFDRRLPLAPADEVGQLGTALVALGDTLERRFGEMRALARLTEQVGAGLLLDEVLDQVYDAFRTLIPYDRIGFALLDEDGRSLRAHWARTSYEGISLAKGYAQRLEGSSLEQVLRSGQPRILNDLEAYLAAHPRSDSTRRVVAEGIRSSLTCPLIAMGKPVGVIFFSSLGRDTYRDAHVRLFQQIAGQLAMLVEKGRLYQRLVEVDAQRGALLGVVAHDLRSPVGVVRGYAQLLRREKFGPCTSAQAGVLDRIVANCDGMLGLVNDLLDVTAIEAGHLRLDLAPVPLGSWLGAALEAERLLAESKGIHVELDSDDELPTLTIDPARMSQVLSNLVSNAVKFSPSGSVITLRVRIAGDSVTIAVVDQGLGIPAAELDRLFKPFGRTSVQPTAGESSTGLGLAICRRIVEAQGGTVRVASTVGQGSTFTVTLPMAGVQTGSATVEEPLAAVA
jgi:hypothetical protein